MSILTAVVTQVPIGNTSVEGLMTEDGVFYIGIPQVADLFEVSRNTAARDFKRLMGENSKPSIKLKTEFNKNVTTAITLTEFEQLVAKLDRKGL